MRRSLSKCLEAVKEWNFNADINFGCKIAAINSNIFVDPEDLPRQRRNPAVLIFEESAGTVEIYGLLESSAQSSGTYPLTFYNAKNEQVCEGTYSTFQPRIGTYQLRCFDDLKSLSGDFTVTGFRKGLPVGTAKGKSATGEKFAIVFGLPSEEYKKQKDTLLK